MELVTTGNIFFKVKLSTPHLHTDYIVKVSSKQLYLGSDLGYIMNVPGTFPLNSLFDVPAGIAGLVTSVTLRDIFKLVSSKER